MTKHELPLSASLIISEKNGQPCLEIRRNISDPETIKKIITAAFYEQGVVILPTFTNKLQSISSLIDKGIMYREGEQLYFLF